MSKITDHGTALPRMVHQGKRVPAFDEDVTTLAAQAAWRLPPAERLVILGTADEEVLAAAIGHAGDVQRASDLQQALDRAGPDGIVVESYAPRMGEAWGAAVHTGDQGEDPPAKLRDLVPDDAPGVVVPMETVKRHVEAFDHRPEETTPMGAYVSPQVWQASLSARYRLEGRRCDNDHTVFPPQPRCPTCGSRQLVPLELSGTGEVYSITVIGEGAAPAEFTTQNQALGTYAVAIIQLSEGPRIVAQLTDCDPDDVQIGDPVRAVFRRIYKQPDGVRYGYKFKPTDL